MSGSEKILSIDPSIFRHRTSWAPSLKSPALQGSASTESWPLSRKSDVPVFLDLTEHFLSTVHDIWLHITTDSWHNLLIVVNIMCHQYINACTGIKLCNCRLIKLFWDFYSILLGIQNNCNSSWSKQQCTVARHQSSSQCIASMMICSHTMPSRSWLSNETSFHRRWTALCVADHNDASTPCMKRPAWARKMNPTSESTENIRNFIADRKRHPEGTMTGEMQHCRKTLFGIVWLYFFAEAQPKFLLWSQTLTPFRKSWPQMPPSQQLFHRSM